MICPKCGNKTETKYYSMEVSLIMCSSPDWHWVLGEVSILELIKS